MITVVPPASPPHRGRLCVRALVCALVPHWPTHCNRESTALPSRLVHSDTTVLYCIMENIID